MDAIDFLTEVYCDYCSKHNLEHVSADEQTGLTNQQERWMSNFIAIWDTQTRNSRRYY